MKISVNIPSHKRPKVETLDFYSDCKIWVADNEIEEYQKNNPNNEIIGLGENSGKNISVIRNHILKSEFGKGADVVCMLDDDVKGIYRFNKSKNNNFGYEKRIVTDFIGFIEKYTTMAIELGAYLWGVNLNKDSRSYQHYKPFNTNKIILGPFSCHIKDGNIFYDENIPLKEDYDLALQHLNKHRKILRLNMYHYVCKQSENKGGCAVYRNYKTEAMNFELLQKKWGKQIVRIDKGSKKEFDYNPIIKVPIKGV
jgi:hypothetical protein